MTDSFIKKVEEKNHIEIFAMSNLRSARTGVDGAVIFVSSGSFDGDKKSQHGPRIKVVVGNKVTSESLSNSIVVSLGDRPREIEGTLPAGIKKNIFDFVKLNLDVLLKYWHYEIDTGDMIEAIKKI